MRVVPRWAQHIVMMLLVVTPLAAQTPPQSYGAAQELRDGTGNRIGVLGNPLITKPDPTSTAAKPSTVTYAAPNASAIVTPNVAVTVFLAGTIATSCDIQNPPGNDTLYLDFVTSPAVAGSATAIRLDPGMSYHCPYPPAGLVSAVADKAQPFVAVRY